MNAQRSKGAAILLLPGIEGGAATFCAQQPLAGRWDLLAADLPAQGCLDADAAALAALLPQRPLLVVGASYGALVGWALAEHRPEQVLGLVGIGALPAPRFLPRSIPRLVKLVSFCPKSAFDRIYRRRIADRLLEEGVPPLRAGVHLSALPARDVLCQRLRALGRWHRPSPPVVPTTWLRGQVDREAPWTLEQAAAALPQAAVETIPGGHRPWLTHPAALHAILEELLRGPLLARVGRTGA